MDGVERVRVQSGGDRGLPVVWSPSAVNDFIKCPLAYWWKYAQGWRIKPTVATASGSLVHDVLEELIGLPAGARTRDAARALFVEQFNGARGAGKYVDFADEVWGRAGTAMRSYFDLEDPAEVAPISDGLELEVAGLLGGVQVAGRADRVEFGVGGARVVDYKTGAARPQYAVGYWRQQLIYAALLTDAGVTTTEVELLYLGDPSARLRRPVADSAVDRVTADVARAAGQRPQSDESTVWEAHVQVLCDYCPFQRACPAQRSGRPVPGSPDSDALLARDRRLVRRVSAVDIVDRVGNPEEPR